MPAPVIATSLFTRFASQDKNSFQLKMVAALRNQFGGHAVTLESGQQGMETETPKPGIDVRMSMITPVEDVTRAFADAVVEAFAARPGPQVRPGALGWADGTGVLRGAGRDRRDRVERWSTSTSATSGWCRPTTRTPTSG